MIKSEHEQALLDRVSTWPEEHQEELMDIIREMEARQTGIYRLSEDERASVKEGLEQARRGEFVPDEVVAEFFSRHRK